MRPKNRTRTAGVSVVSECSDFLLTWNCRHLANAEITAEAAHLLREQGFLPPVVCTPEELMGESYV